MDVLTLGLVGLGGFGQFLLRVLQNVPGISVVAVADSSLADNSRFSGFPVYKNWEAMVAERDIEALCIATPPSTHVDIAISAMKKGLHVFIEKPLATNPDHAKHIIQVAEETDRIAMVNFMQRKNPVLSSIKDIYQEGLLGEFNYFTIQNDAQDESLISDHWFWDSRISGGILIEHAVHFIDIVHWFTGNSAIKHLTGWQELRDTGLRDRMGLTAQYENGCIINHYHSFSRPQFFEKTVLTLAFSLAEFKLYGWIPESGSFSILGLESMADTLNEYPLLSIEHVKDVPNVPVRGVRYGYERRFSGTIKALQSKDILYTNAVADMFIDFHKAVAQADYKPVVDARDGLNALNVAYFATKYAESKA
ncbi:MAG: Gfo/Idh/MocA family oxidoreductase [Bacteroidota bacterium]